MKRTIDMTLLKNTARQSKTFVKIIFIVYVPILLLLGFVTFMSFRLGKPIDYFFQDIFSITAAPLYAGFISNIGLIGWSFTTGVCFFSFLVFRNSLADRKLHWFFLTSGLFTLLLLFDDFFLFHEILYPRYLHINSMIAYFIYASLGLLYLWYFRKIILQSDYLILIIALAGFFISNVFDKLREYYLFNPYWIILEEGFKLIGIASWLVYFTLSGMNALRNSLKTYTDSPL